MAAEMTLESAAEVLRDAHGIGTPERHAINVLLDGLDAQKGKMALTAEEVQWAFGGLQELKLRHEEGDDTARLTEQEERLRKNMERMLGSSARDYVPWSKREGSELVRDLRSLLYHEDDVKAAARMLGEHVLRETQDEWEDADVELWQERMAFAMRAVGLFTPEEVRDMLRRFYNRSDDEAERVVRTWQEVRRG